MGFFTSAYFIIGFPYESREEIMDTVNFAYTCGIDYAIFFIAKPFFGAEMYEIYEKEGLLKVATGASSSCFVAKCDTIYCTAEELTRMRADAERRFPMEKMRWCLKPGNFISYVLPKLSSLNNIRYIARILFAIMSGKHKR